METVNQEATEMVEVMQSPDLKSLAIRLLAFGFAGGDAREKFDGYKRIYGNEEQIFNTALTQYIMESHDRTVEFMKSANVEVPTAFSLEYLIQPDEEKIAVLEEMLGGQINYDIIWGYGQEGKRYRATIVDNVGGLSTGKVEVTSTNISIFAVQVMHVRYTMTLLPFYRSYRRVVDIVEAAAAIGDFDEYQRILNELSADNGVENVVDQYISIEMNGEPLMSKEDGNKICTHISMNVVQVAEAYGSPVYELRTEWQDGYDPDADDDEDGETSIENKYYRVYARRDEYGDVRIDVSADQVHMNYAFGRNPIDDEMLFGHFGDEVRDTWMDIVVRLVEQLYNSEEKAEQ